MVKGMDGRSWEAPVYQKALGRTPVKGVAGCNPPSGTGEVARPHMVQFSRITCAIACSAVCESDRAMFLAPSLSANSAALPWNVIVGRLPG